MKQLLFFFLLQYPILLFGQHLNSYGHIIVEDSEQKVVVQQIADHPYCQYKGLSLQGNGCYPAKERIATVESSCGNTPSMLRLFDTKASLLFEKQYPQVISLQFNQSQNFIHFLCHGKWLVLNLATYEEQIIASAYPIAVNAEGDVAYFNPTNNQHM